MLVRFALRALVARAEARATKSKILIAGKGCAFVDNELRLR